MAQALETTVIDWKDCPHQRCWHELENGDLLTAAQESGFEVMVTGENNLSYQQTLAGRTLALVML